MCLLGGGQSCPHGEVMSRYIVDVKGNGIELVRSKIPHKRCTCWRHWKYQEDTFFREVCGCLSFEAPLVLTFQSRCGLCNKLSHFVSSSAASFRLLWQLPSSVKLHRLHVSLDILPLRSCSYHGTRYMPMTFQSNFSGLDVQPLSSRPIYPTARWPVHSDVSELLQMHHGKIYLCHNLVLL